MLATPTPYDNICDSLLNKLHTEGRYREFANLERVVGKFPMVKEHLSDGTTREVIVWCSNDYLGMGHCDKVLHAMHSALDDHGAGSGGTRNISGNSSSITALEEELASLHNKEAGLVFSSGYVANVTALSTLAMQIPNCIVLSDEENHASMIQGIKGSKAEKIIFRHNDVEQLEGFLKEIPYNRPKIIAFESVYSMGGDFGEIEKIISLAKRYGALTFLDETHGVGLYGRHGGGVAQELGLQGEIDIIQGGLGKGYGVVGGFITGNKKIIDVVRSYGTGFIFTTSLPPVIAEGAIASVKYLKANQNKRMIHQQKAKRLKTKMKSAGLPLMETPSHILPIRVGDSVLCKKITDYLLHTESIYIQPINYPTVPKGTERLRITPSPLHTEEQMNELVDALLRAWAHFELDVAA